VPQELGDLRIGIPRDETVTVGELVLAQFDEVALPDDARFRRGSRGIWLVAGKSHYGVRSSEEMVPRSRSGGDHGAGACFCSYRTANGAALPDVGEDVPGDWIRGTMKPPSTAVEGGFMVTRRFLLPVTGSYEPAAHSGAYQRS